MNDNRMAKGRADARARRHLRGGREGRAAADRYVIALDLLGASRSNYFDRAGRRSQCAAPDRHGFACAAAAARPISRTSSCRRWRSSIAAICVPEQMPKGSWPARLARRQSTPTCAQALRRRFRLNGLPPRCRRSRCLTFIASTTNNLKRDGWKAGETLGLRGRGAAGLQLHARRPR